jgi:RimJ/RimL family protein N-acetyltransferase
VDLLRDDPIRAATRIPLPSQPQQPYSYLSIFVNDQYAGGVSVEEGSAERRIVGEIGYWLGEKFWRRGVMTAVLPAFIDYVFKSSSPSPR